MTVEIKRQYFETKVWVRERLVWFALIYLWGAFGFLVGASFIKGNITVAICALAPLALVIKLVTTDPSKEAPQSSTDGAQSNPCD